MKKRKLLSALLALALVVGLIPTFAIPASAATTSVEFAMHNGKVALKIIADDATASMAITVMTQDVLDAYSDDGNGDYTYAGPDDVAANLTSYAGDSGIILNSTTGIAAGSVVNGENYVDLTLTKADHANKKLLVWVYDSNEDAASAKTNNATLNANALLPAAKHSVTYAMGAGATGTLPTQADVEEGLTFNLAAKPADAEKAGFRFMGWNDGTKDYAAGAVYTMGTSNVTLTAVWKQEYTVTYALDGGNGTLPTQTPKIQGEKFNLAASTGLTKTGYTFNKWNDGTSDYAAGAQYTMGTANVTLTAKWTAIPVNFTDNNNVEKSGKVNTAFSLTLPSAKDGSGSGYTYALTGDLPTGLNQTGGPTGAITISGTPTAEETKTLTYKVTDTNGTNKSITVKITIGAKDPQTVTAANVTATFGDTGKKITASTNGNGALSYTVKDGGDVIDVDGTGALTIKKAGTAHVTVTAAETTEYSEATKEVTVTVNKKKLTVNPTLTAGGEFPESAEVDGVTVKLAWTNSDNSALDAGAKPEKGKTYNWTATLEAADQTNYELTKESGTVKLSGGSSGGGGSASQDFTVKYDVNEHGSLNGVSSEKVEKGKKPAKVPTPEADRGYAFVGWSADGGKTFVDPADQAISANVTFTAMFGHKAYVQGRPGAVFVPNGPITRAEAVRMLCNLHDDFDFAGSYASAYSDVKAADWFASAVGYGTGHGFVTGYPDGTYKPNGNITRAEFSAMVARYMGMEPEQGSTSFNDVAGHWAEGYITAMVNQDVIEGYNDGTFRPNQAITRAEAVRIMNGVLDRRVADGKDFGKYSNPYLDVDTNDWFYEDVLEASLVHVIEDLH